MNMNKSSSKEYKQKYSYDISDERPKCSVEYCENLIAFIGSGIVKTKDGSRETKNLFLHVCKYHSTDYMVKLALAKCHGVPHRVQ